MNLPNRLTMLRIFLVPVCVFFLLMQNIPHAYLWAMLVFIGASVTDLFDGKIARKRNLITNFGKLLDPLADKLTLVGMVRGRKKALKQMVEFFQKNFDPNQGEHTVFVGHADCPEDMARLKEKLEATENGSQAEFIEGTIGPVIGSHVGPGMFACVFWGPDRRNNVSLTDRIARRVKSE